LFSPGQADFSFQYFNRSQFILLTLQTDLFFTMPNFFSIFSGLDSFVFLPIFRFLQCQIDFFYLYIQYFTMPKLIFLPWQVVFFLFFSPDSTHLFFHLYLDFYNDRQNYLFSFTYIHFFTMPN